MTNAMTEKLASRKLSDAGSLRKFVESEILANKAVRTREVVGMLMLVLRIPDHESDLREVVAFYVSDVERDLRANAELKRRNAETTANRSIIAQNVIEQRRRQDTIERVLDGLIPELHRLQDELLNPLAAQFTPLASRHYKGCGEKRALMRSFAQGFFSDDDVGVLEDRDWQRACAAAQDIVDERRRNSMWKKAQAELASNLQKAASFDRMVMALDAIMVGSKALGDCTGADLLREAVKLEEFAAEATAQSVFYRQLAGIVGKTTTVREASDRAGIVGLLTSRYREPQAIAAE